jgi:hypothetical protein
MLDLNTMITELRRDAPARRDLVFLSREAALESYEGSFADAMRAYGAAQESDIEGAHVAQWTVRATGRWETLRIIWQDRRLTVELAAKPD